MSGFILQASTLGALVSHGLLVLGLIVFLARLPFAKAISDFIGKQALKLIFAVSFIGVIGSLLYSEVLGFEPCVLCWWQRISLYPIALMSLLGLIWKDNRIIKYIIAVAIPGALIALYHSYTQLGGYSLTSCTSQGGDCARVYVLEYGYITIPLMALTTFIWIFIFAWFARKNESLNP